jgi:hypothetical protein
LAVVVAMVVASSSTAASASIGCASISCEVPITGNVPTGGLDCREFGRTTNEVVSIAIHDAPPGRPKGSAHAGRCARPAAPRSGQAISPANRT